MDTPTAQFDPLEHYLAAVQLDQIVLANRDKGWAACRNVMVQWHLKEVRAARGESVLPHDHSARDPGVEEAIIRFYQYQVRLTVERLKNESKEPSTAPE
jgi:hypothetical protein